MSYKPVSQMQDFKPLYSHNERHLPSLQWPLKQQQNISH